MSNKKSKKSIDSFDEKNAAALVDMLTDLQTSENVRIQIINELNEAEKNKDFFETMFNEELSVGACPHCAHQDHWLIPADILSQMGWIIFEEDKRIPRNTDSKSCPEFAEACKKKKVHF